MPLLAALECTVWDSRDRLDFWCLTGAISMVGLALGTLLPLTALQLDAQGLSSSSIGLVIAVHALGLVGAVLICERFAGRFGARRTVEWFGLAAAGTAVMMQCLTSVVYLAAALFILGLFLGVVLNMVETWVNEVIPETQRGRWLAIHCTMFTMFQLCGPVLLQHISARFAYVICAGLMYLAWPIYRKLSARTLGECDACEGGEISWMQYLLGAPVVVLSTALFALFDTIILGLLPVYGLAQGMDTAAALASASVVLAGDTALEIVIGVLADRYGRARVHSICALTLLTTSLLLPLSIGSLLWWPLLFLLGGAAGGIYVLSMMACGQRFSGRHLLRITALLGSVWGVASIVGPLVTGSLMAQANKWSIPAVVFTMATSLLAALVYERNLNNKPTREFSRA